MSQGPYRHQQAIAKQTGRPRRDAPFFLRKCNYLMAKLSRHLIIHYVYTYQLFNLCLSDLLRGASCRKPAPLLRPYRSLQE